MLVFRNKRVTVNIIVDNGTLISTNFGTTLPLIVELTNPVFTTLNIVTTGNLDFTIQSVVVSGVINQNPSASPSISLQIPCSLEDSSVIDVVFNYVANILKVTVEYSGCQGNTHIANSPFSGIGPYLVNRGSNITVTGLTNECCVFSGVSANVVNTVLNNSITLNNLQFDAIITFSYTHKQVIVNVIVNNGIRNSSTPASQNVNAGSSVTLGANGNANHNINSIVISGMSPNPTPSPSNAYTLNVPCNLVNNSVITVTFNYVAIQWDIIPNVNIGNCGSSGFNWTGNLIVNNNGSTTITLTPTNLCCSVLNWEVTQGTMTGNKSGIGNSATLTGVQSNIYIKFNLIQKTFAVTVIHNHPTGCSGSNHTATSVQGISSGNGSSGNPYIVNCNNANGNGNITVTTTPGSCCVFNGDYTVSPNATHWVGNGQGGGNRNQITISPITSSSITLTFNYTLGNHNVTVNANPSTAIICTSNNCNPNAVNVASLTGNGIVACGNSTTVGYSSLNPHFHFIGNTNDFGLSTIASSHTFTPTKSGTITFNFARVVRQVKITLEGCTSSGIITITSTNNNSNIGTNVSNGVLTNGVNSLTRTSEQIFYVNSGTCINVSVAPTLGICCANAPNININGNITQGQINVNSINNLCISTLTNIVFTYSNKSVNVTITANPSYMGTLQGHTTGIYPACGFTFNITANPANPTLYKFIGWRVSTINNNNILSGNGSNNGFNYTVNGNNIVIVNSNSGADFNIVAEFTNV